MSPDYGSPVYAALRDTASDWHRYTRHQFVVGLGDGTLPRTAFLHYLVQDYVFLIHFSRAWALGVVKAQTLDEMRICAGTVAALIDEEMKLHVSICAAEGISEDDLEHAVEEPENLAYTRYVLDAGFSGDFLSLVTALAPCVFGYGEIGLHLQRTKTSDVYDQWISTYAGDDYQSVCRSIAAMIEKATVLRLGPDPTRSPRWPALINCFATATRLEVGFWDMGLKGA